MIEILATVLDPDNDGVDIGALIRWNAKRTGMIRAALGIA